MPVEVIMPKVDMDMANGIIAQWHAKEGDAVKEGEPLFDIETDKANMEVEAPASGVLQQVVASNGDTVDIGVCIAQIYAEGEQVSAVQSTVPSTDYAEKVRATPLARKLADQHNVALQSITGSGPRGRITKSDVENAAGNSRPMETTSPSPQSTIASTAQLDSLGVAYTRLPVARMRATIAQRLTDSKSSVPHFYLESDCRVDSLQAYRKEINEALGPDSSVKVSLNDLIVMAAAKALEAVPEANVSWAGNEVLQYKDANVSVAVSIEGGLMTPVLRAAQDKSITSLSTELADLSARARLGKLSPNEYQGGSMSVTNLGMFGVQRFQAIINPPESMILAVGSASRQIVPDDNDQPTAASVMAVCLSCDHRVLDGVVAARWLKAFQDRIETPIRLML